MDEGNNTGTSSLKTKLSTAIARVKQANLLKLPAQQQQTNNNSEERGPPRRSRSYSLGLSTRARSTSQPESLENTDSNSSNNNTMTTTKGRTASTTDKSPKSSRSRTQRILSALTPRSKKRSRSRNNASNDSSQKSKGSDTHSDVSSIVDDLHTNIPSSVARLQEMKQEEYKRAHTEPSNGLKMLTKKVSQAAITKKKSKHNITHHTSSSPMSKGKAPETADTGTDFDQIPYAVTEKDYNSSVREAEDPTFTEEMTVKTDNDEESDQASEITTPRDDKKKSQTFVPSLSLASAVQLQTELVLMDDSGSSGSSGSSFGSHRKMDDLSTEQLIHQCASLNKADKLRELLIKERDRLRQDEDDDLALKTLFSDVVNCVDSRDQSTPLHKAAAKNNCEVLELLLKEFKETRIDAKDNLESTALHWACSNAALEAIFILCKFGASINVRDKYGYGPLHLTIKKKCYRGADVLLLYNADINFKMSNGSAAMHWACENNELDILKWLLTKDKINIHSRDKLKEVPIMRAAAKGNMEIVEFMMKKNLVDWKLRDDKLQSLLHKAAYAGINDLIMKIANMNPVACNTMMNEKDRDGNTPLHLAVKKDHFRAIKSLCMMGADMNTQNKHGDTPMHVALILKDYKTARYLFQSGASADIKNKKGLTARQMADSQKSDQTTSATTPTKANDSFKKNMNEDPSKLFI
jgi:ankyrin repeat protein